MLSFEETACFHGHKCPGLAIGYRMATALMKKLESLRSEDEELVAIVENDACGVDALQCVSGCTFGKGNLKFHDFGKQVYTLYSRSSGKGIRAVFHGKGIPGNLREDRMAFTEWMLRAPLESIISFTFVSVGEPEPARIRKSLSCFYCGESVMETRVRELNGSACCIPCHQAVAGRLQ